MQNNNLEISIAHLYPKLLNIYGDFGNVLTIKNRCEARGIGVKVSNIEVGDEIDISKYDLYFIGGGQDKQQIEVSKELKKREDVLKEASINNVVFLSICGGYQLFGKYYQPHEGDRLEGINLLDAYTIAGHNRFIGNVTAETNFLDPKTLVGFENHSGLTFLEEGTEPLATILVGNGNNGQDKFEGARKHNVFGTYLHGSLLPKNPHFADYLIKLALDNKYKDGIELDKINDELEYKAHFDLINKKY